MKSYSCFASQECHKADKPMREPGPLCLLGFIHGFKTFLPSFQTLTLQDRDYGLWILYRIQSVINNEWTVCIAHCIQFWTHRQNRNMIISNKFIPLALRLSMLQIESSSDWYISPPEKRDYFKGKVFQVARMLKAQFYRNTSPDPSFTSLAVVSLHPLLIHLAVSKESSPVYIKHYFNFKH